MRPTASALVLLAAFAMLLVPAGLSADDAEPFVLLPIPSHPPQPGSPDPADAIIHGDSAELVLTGLREIPGHPPTELATVVIALRTVGESIAEMTCSGTRLDIFASLRRATDGKFSLQLGLRAPPPDGHFLAMATWIPVGRPVVMTWTRDVFAGLDLRVLLRPGGPEAVRRARGITLGIGDAAPPLTVGSWVVGAPVTSLADGHLTVVEFGKSWQYLYRDAQPRLAAMQERFAGKGLRTIAIKIPRTGDAGLPPRPPPALLALADHHVAIDDIRPQAGGAPATATAWLRAAGRWLPREEDFRTPTAMIVDGTGRIRWVGDPRRELERVVAGMLDGTWVGVSVVSVDSEQIDADEKAENATDGDPSTIWHTQWKGGHPQCPHDIILAMSQDAELSGITYLPRQDSLTNGDIGDYELYLSRDGVAFGEAVQRGTFAADKSLKVVSFPPQWARFIRLRALTAAGGLPWSSAAEIGILRPGDPPPVVPPVLPREVDDSTSAGADGF